MRGTVAKMLRKQAAPNDNAPMVYKALKKMWGMISQAQKAQITKETRSVR